MVSTPKSKGKPSHPVRRRTIVVKKTKKSLAPSFDTDLDVSDYSDFQNYAKITDAILPERPYVERAVAHLLSKIEHQSKNDKKELFDDDKVVQLQLSIGKIPQWTFKTLHIPLAHSILPAEHDILLITPDLKKEEVTDYEKNVEYYQAMLAQCEIEGVKEIIPFHQLKAEYGEYEMQSKLMGLYDMIICDTTVHTYVLKTFGALLSKRKKLYHRMKIALSNLQNGFEKATKQSLLNIHGNGDCFAMQIGHLGMDESQLVDNILTASEELDKKLPGGFKYVKYMHLKSAKSNAVPFYISSVNFSSLKLPKDEKSKLHSSVKGELSTEMDAEVIVTPDGDVLFAKTEAGDEAKPKRSRKEPERLQMPKLKAIKKKQKQKSEDKENDGGKRKRAAPKKAGDDKTLTEKAGNNKKAKKPTKKAKLSNGSSEGSTLMDGKPIAKPPKEKVKKQPKEKTPKLEEADVKPKTKKTKVAEKSEASETVTPKIKKEKKKNVPTTEVTAPSAKEQKTKEPKKEKEVKEPKAKAPKKEAKKGKEAEQASLKKASPSPKRKLDESNAETEVVAKKKGKKAGKKTATN